MAPATPAARLPYPADGTWPLLDRGDDMLECLVLQGPCAGTVWQTWSRGWTPVVHPTKGTPKPERFIDWVVRYIEDLLAGAPPAVDADATSLD